MPEIFLTKSEARKFILYKQGLLGEYKFSGKSGILDFIRQAGCIQFDPIDICGRNAELVLLSRVKGFSKIMLYELLYYDRKLLDYSDKNLSIIPLENWKYFERERKNHCIWEKSSDEIMEVHDKIISSISEHGPLCSSDLNIPQKVDWYWSKTKLSRAALEHMYFKGELAIHHKKGGIKYYDLIEKCIPACILNEPDPFPCDFDHKKWRVLKRIGSLGLLWNKASDAWLGIHGLKAQERDNIFSELLSEKRITYVKVENTSHELYCLTEDIQIIDHIKNNNFFKQRCEFIAPLDNMMWDRNLIKDIFDFEYKWEIYTPQANRKYGYYVLPVLYGDRLVGRIEPVYDRKNKKLNILNIWYEPDIKLTKGMEKNIMSAIRRLEKLNIDSTALIKKTTETRTLT